jgi:hypothetical protein
MRSKQQKEWNWKQEKNRQKNLSIVVCGNCQHLEKSVSRAVENHLSGEILFL